MQISLLSQQSLGNNSNNEEEEEEEEKEEDKKDKKQTESKSLSSIVEFDLYYQCRSPWKWVFEEAFAEVLLEKERCYSATFLSRCSNSNTTKISIQRCQQVSRVKDLPSNLTNGISNTVNTKNSGGCTLRMEWIGSIRSSSENNNNNDDDDGPICILYYHGTSTAMDGLADKDEFVRTMKNHQCEHLSPPTILIDWDVSDSFCRSVIFPTIQTKITIESSSTTIDADRKATAAANECNIINNNNNNNNYNSDVVAILKTPLGSRGEGVYFISHVEELVSYVRQNYIRAITEGKGKFLKDIYQTKGRIPSWVLQAEIYPPMLLQQSKKFHLRSYVVVIERNGKNNRNSSNNRSGTATTKTLDVYIYNRHEVRVASVPFFQDENAEENFIASTDTTKDSSTTRFNNSGNVRNRRAHITNGASSDDTKRCLLHHIQELAPISGKLETFLAQAFGHDLLRNMMFHVNNNNTYITTAPTKFAFSGVDIMLDENGRFYILEINVNPAAPPKEIIDMAFHRHLVDLCKDLIHLVVETSDTMHNHDTTAVHEDSRSQHQFNFVLASDILNSLPPNI